MEQTGNEQDYENVTIETVVEIAAGLREKIADQAWRQQKASREDLSELVQRLGWLIMVLPVKPQGGEITLHFRLARAEAERLGGACMCFKRVRTRLKLWRKDDLSEAAKEAIDVAAEQLYVASGAFLAMARME